MAIKVALLALLLSVCLAEEVLTPFGYRPAECVKTVPHDATIRETETGVEVTHVDGTVEIHVPSDSCHADNINGRTAARRQLSSGFPVINGWLDYAGWYPPSGENNLQRFTANYTVPGNPPTTGQQVLFYFIGMQNNDDPNAVNILQPVLTWGNQGLTGWNAASWACCPKNITFQSPTITGFKAGSEVGGIIERMSADTWKITFSFGDMTSILNAQVGDYQYNWADVTQEVYNVEKCDQFATGPITFSNLELWDNQMKQIVPSWTKTGGTVCKGSTTVAGDKITIMHSTR